MNKYEKLIIYCDGGSRGNPGPGGIGAVIYDDKKNKIAEIFECIGVSTNNQAEYRAVLAAIEKARTLTDNAIDFYLDSELVVNQLSRKFKIKNQELAALFLKIYNISLSFKKVTYSHIPREMNSAADKLVNMALDKAGY